MFKTRLIVFLFLLLLGNVGFSQSFSPKRQKVILVPNEGLKFDSLSIFPGTFQIRTKSGVLAQEEYILDNGKAFLKLLRPIADSCTISYEILPFDFSQKFQKRDTSVLYQSFKGDREKFLIESTYSVNDVFGGTELNKNGSISRGVSFGNNQDLGINSSLNLELSGQIAPNLKVLASVSDANLPIQPDGSTNKLQEFDQVYIQVYNDNVKVVAGDFWLSKPTGYFMNYRKRAQGLTNEFQWKNNADGLWKTQVSGALSKGKFNRQVIQGIEANQGPYRLRGADNEPFILVLAGTERVFIDGKLLTRGQEFDYTIDYNTAELIFTSRHQITKDIRIVVEFQYADQNYARSLFQSATSYSGKKLDFWLNAYSEQDAKNQSLQQNLTSSQKQFLGTIGDNLDQARISSIDSIGFIDNQVLYRLTDSLGFDSVLVFSVNPQLANFRAAFLFVGSNKGNYILENFNALGKVFRWVAPINGIPQGDHEAARILITPKKNQMFTTGAKYQISKKWLVEAESAISTFDKNTFSSLDAEDNGGFAQRARLSHSSEIGRDSIKNWMVENALELEFLSAHFQPIEQFRRVEFDRDWNTRGRGYIGSQRSLSGGSKWKHKNFGGFMLEGQYFGIGNDFTGQRLATEGRWQQKGWVASWDGSVLNAQALDENRFIRHRSNISKQIGALKIGYIDDHEWNTFESNDVLRPNSYQFFDHQYYISNHDSADVYFKLFYRERYDRQASNGALKGTAKARSAGGEFRVADWKNQRIQLLAAYRTLTVQDSILMPQAPENSLVGRLEYDARWWKSAFTVTTFYEVGSGLEQRREFQYIKVNDGQGIYTWVDYNGDGIKDLNEFEIAQFVDQASYIRVFTPSAEYVRTYSNEFNQSLFWRPERIWANKKGVLKGLSLFSNQARFRVNRKLNAFDPQFAFNPFAGNIDDVALISTTATIRNTLFFNRTSNVISGEYTFQDNRTKTLLASGFDSKRIFGNLINFRWNITPKWSLESEFESGVRQSIADYTIGRNYNYSLQSLKPLLSYQPSTNFRIGAGGRQTQKQNDIILGGESALVHELNANVKWNQTNKGSLQGEAKLVRIQFTGNPNSPVGFELLEALRPGVNYTWTFGYQRNLSKNLQMTINYLGRKSENTRFIHSGGMEVRAFF
jgi:hypothetical protein